MLSKGQQRLAVKLAQLNVTLLNDLRHHSLDRGPEHRQLKLKQLLVQRLGQVPGQRAEHSHLRQRKKKESRKKGWLELEALRVGVEVAVAVGKVLRHCGCVSGAAARICCCGLPLTDGRGHYLPEAGSKVQPSPACVVL